MLPPVQAANLDRPGGRDDEQSLSGKCSRASRSSSQSAQVSPFLAATPGMIEPRRMYSPCSTLLLNPIEIFPLFGRQQVIPVEITFTGQTLTAG